MPNKEKQSNMVYNIDYPSYFDIWLLVLRLDYLPKYEFQIPYRFSKIPRILEQCPIQRYLIWDGLISFC